MNNENGKKSSTNKNDKDNLGIDFCMVSLYSTFGPTRAFLLHPNQSLQGVFYEDSH